ncbi:hypothetical protein R1flu_006579 [Riccia fluitans]|uniref:Serine/threonine-protein phosphatase 2A activator n=1 Tax=Riccia fluitans TaxID=41844 RepID=A0ABD1YWS2_9MARC
MAANERMSAVTEAPSTSSSVERGEEAGAASTTTGGGYSAIGGLGSWPGAGLSGGGMRPPSFAPVQSLAPGSPLTLAALAPVPQARPVPLVQPPYSFVIPRKRITSPADIERFHQSEAGKMLLGFIVGLSDSVKGMKLSDYCKESTLIIAIVGILKRMSEWVDEIPPKQQPARYGNLSFRDWQSRLEIHGPNLVRQILPEALAEAVLELFPYFQDSFGNAIRIDFGTGHEVNFAAWLLCLARLGLIKQEDYQAVVLRVFVEYLDLMRKLQTTYWLEPAGSHGVWGLDDYHFLPFIFGSAQLVDHKYMKPKSIHNQDILEHYSKEYLYLGCVQFVKKVKKGPLAEHSPMIDDISGVPTWTKVNGGMLKMFRAEVLEKVPIMQHFLFGSLIPW